MVIVMTKTRTYSKTRNCVECFVYQGVNLVMHLVYYPGFGYGYPRYHFENFCLQVNDLNYEIRRFMNFVAKVSAYPQLDLDKLQDEEFDLHLGL